LGAAVIDDRLPGIRDLCIHFAGLDPTEEPIPIQPGQHYSMGGLDVATDGSTSVEGFFAAGEAACLSVHGANRLGGNSLLETIVFGARAGEAAATFLLGRPSDPARRARSVSEALGRFEAKLDRLLSRRVTEDAYAMRAQVTEVMDADVQVFRSGEGLARAVRTLSDLRDRYDGVGVRSRGKIFNLDMLRVLELDTMLDLALATAEAALAREESRGAHSRLDFAERDDKRWLRHTLAYRTDSGPRLEYKPVVVDQFQPQERVY
ncbi:MAG: FAD-binding protein, partial [Thermoleophilia bacterium]